MPDWDNDYQTFDYRSLSEPQRATLRLLAIRLAHAAREAMLRHAFRALWSRLGAGTNRLRRYFSRCWAAYRTRRSRNRAAAELRGLDDRVLRDLGISRSEIVSLVANGRDDATRMRRPAGARAATAPSAAPADPSAAPAVPLPSGRHRRSQNRAA